MKLTLTFFICLIISVGFVLSAEATQKPIKVDSAGETIIVSKSEEFNVRVVIKTHQKEIGQQSDVRPSVIRSACTYSRYPCSIVDYIDIFVNDKPIIVTHNVFCSLSDLNTAEIQLKQKEAVLLLTGGDASESYIMKIYFDAVRVKHTVVYSGEAPNKPLIETSYHLVVD
jgi:hypothetical protein